MEKIIRYYCRAFRKTVSTPLGLFVDFASHSQPYMMYSMTILYWALVEGTNDDGSRSSMVTRRPAAVPIIVAMVRIPDDVKDVKDEMEYYVRSFIHVNVFTTNVMYVLRVQFLPFSYLLPCSSRRSENNKWIWSPSEVSRWPNHSTGTRRIRGPHCKT